MLILMEVTTEIQVQRWAARFDELDVNGSGKLDEADLRCLQEQLTNPLTRPHSWRSRLKRKPAGRVPPLTRTSNQVVPTSESLPHGPLP